jgi:phospholipid N-methyltransferase
MKRRIAEYSTFFREFRRTFHTTGAMTPSGRYLARALTRPIVNHSRPVRILEAGPGTGAVTQEIVRHVRPGDELHIVELNDRFVESLRRRFESDPRFHRIASQTQIIHAPVQDVSPDEPYDYIVCGIPFNNFPPHLVRTIFRHMMGVLKPGGTLTFFEYLWVRPIKMLVASPGERRRVAKVGCVLRRYIDRYERDRDNVYLNVFPAVAHYLHRDSNGKATKSNGSPHP